MLHARIREKMLCFTYTHENSKFAGREKGQFMTTGKQMDKVLEQAGGDPLKVNKMLGTEFKATDELIRVDVKAPLIYNARLPNASMEGANSQYVEGGQTSGGVSELAIDGVPSVEVTSSPVQ